MWQPIDDAETIGLYRQSRAGIASSLLCELLEQIAAQDWPKQLYVCTSMGNLSITTGSYQDRENHGEISIFQGDGLIGLRYFSPAGDRTDGKLVYPTQALDIFKIYSIRLFHEAGSSPRRISEDSDSDSPKFDLGDRVAVVLNEHNKTPRVGVIAEMIWHSKHDCWTYYIRRNGKMVKKRYYAEDLVIADDLNQWDKGL